MEHILEARQLTKTFGSFRAVDQLSFGIKPGDIYGFLGQNGAGKSTTLRMVLGLIYPDNGSVYIKGELLNNSSRKLLKHVGAIIERPDMYGYLSGRDNLKMFARISGSKVDSKRLDEVFTIVGLKGREQDKVRAYSQGMKQRLGIAIAMVHNPDLLILDEPTNGLDPQGIADMRQLILRLSKEFGKTILISSHLLYEIEQMATRMIIINRGKKIVEGPTRDLLRPEETLMEIDFLHNDAITSLMQRSEWGSVFVSGNETQAVVKMHPEQMPRLNNWLVANGAQVLEIRSKHSLEAYFLSLTNDTHAATGTV
ncbi:MAG: ABC transporter ATP-binding protein [Sphingobacteriales bacterium]|nr:MAG: ABC transporter ATP-binding protein [Sphingobacteriales bacterium]